MQLIIADQEEKLVARRSKCNISVLTGRQLVVKAVFTVLHIYKQILIAGCQ